MNKTTLVASKVVCTGAKDF